MNDIQLIIHRITRHSPDSTVALKVGRAPVSGHGLSLLNQCHQTFRRLQPKAWGTFSEKNRSTEALINDYMAERQSFVSLNERLTAEIVQQLSSVERSFDGWLLVAHDNAHEKLHMYWLPPVNSLSFDGERVFETEHFDTGQVKIGFLFDLAAINTNKTSPYTQFYASRGFGPIAEALANTMGFESSIETETETKALLENIRTFVNLQPENERRSLHQQAIDICMHHDKVGEPLEINTLTTQFPESARDAFIEFLKHCEQPPPERVHLNRRYLKRYVRFYGRSRDLSLSFSSDRLGKGVVYLTDEDALYITELPSGLKLQLQKYISESE